MQPANLFPLLVVLIAIAFALGYARSRALATPLGGIRNLKSLPFYYAARAALWCGLPALLILLLWLGFEDKVIQLVVVGSLPAELRPESVGQASLVLSQISNVASGALSAESVPAAINDAASLLVTLRDESQMIMTLLVICIAVLSAFIAWLRIAPHVNAREKVESILRKIFFLCAGLAIVTTAGIIFLVIFETISFFQKVPMF